VVPSIRLLAGGTRRSQSGVLTTKKKRRDPKKRRRNLGDERGEKKCGPNWSTEKFLKKILPVMLSRGKKGGKEVPGFSRPGKKMGKKRETSEQARSSKGLVQNKMLRFYHHQR